MDTCSQSLDITILTGPQAAGTWGLLGVVTPRLPCLFHLGILNDKRSTNFGQDHTHPHLSPLPHFSRAVSELYGSCDANLGLTGVIGSMTGINQILDS